MKYFAALFVCFLLSGCGLAKPTAGMPMSASPLAVGVAVDTVSVINSQKTIGDHIVSGITGKECSSPRQSIHGGDYCQDKPLPPEKQPPVYCYRTLGTPDCYYTPQPEPYRRVGN